jgi:hypothetical protein
VALPSTREETSFSTKGGATENLMEKRNSKAQSERCSDSLNSMIESSLHSYVAVSHPSFLVPLISKNSISCKYPTSSHAMRLTPNPISSPSFAPASRFQNAEPFQTPSGFYSKKVYRTVL